MKLTVFGLFAIALGGCATGIAPSIDTDVLAVAAQAEEFVVRHGYTAAGQNIRID